MKFFTKEWCCGELEDVVVDNVLSDYEKYIKNIFLKLPFTIRMLAKNISLHDGIIKKILVKYANQSVRIEGIFGDLQAGYFTLKIKYLNVLNLEEMKTFSSLQEEKLEILSDEIEMKSTNNFAHRILFSNKKEIEFLFEDLVIEMANASAKLYTKVHCQVKIE